MFRLWQGWGATPLCLAIASAAVGLPPAGAPQTQWQLLDEWHNLQRLYIELPAKPMNLKKRQVFVRLLSDESYPQSSPYRDRGVLSVVTTYLADCQIGAEAAYQFHYYRAAMAQGLGIYDSGQSLAEAQHALERPWAGSTIDTMIQKACRSVGWAAPAGKIFPQGASPH